MKNESINSISIFCGSNMGSKISYRKEAENLIDVMYSEEISLIYGGANVGLMGIIADRMLNHNGKVIGVIPQSLVDVEIAHKNLTELHIVNSMHARKVLISKLSDAFIMIPGGIGSLDEFFEMLTLAKLGFHTKPCGILNTEGYYDGLLKFLDKMVEEEFLESIHRNMIIVSDSPFSLIRKLTQYQVPMNKKWINKGAIPVVEV